MFNQENNKMSLEFVILQALNETQVVSKINLCLFVIAVLEKKNMTSKELLKLKKELLAVFKDKQKNRAINLRDSLIKDESLAYFSRDYGKEDELRYREDIEEIIENINLVLIDAYALAYVEITGKTGRKIDLEGVESGAFR